VLDWFHFLETVLCCLTLIVINRMSSYDLLYQFALIAVFELFYYGLNICSCFFLLFYERWAILNLVVHVLSNHPPRSPTVVARGGGSGGIVVSCLEKYASLLRKNRRLRLVVSSIEEIQS